MNGIPTETLVQIVVTLLVPVVTQLLKGGLDGSGARWLTFALSVLAGAAIIGVGEGFKLPSTADPVAFVSALIVASTAVFGVATQIYHEVFKRFGLFGATQD